MIVKLLTEHHLDFLSFKGGCRGSSESTHIKMPQCWKSHALAHLVWCMTSRRALKDEIIDVTCGRIYNQNCRLSHDIHVISHILHNV